MIDVSGTDCLLGQILNAMNGPQQTACLAKGYINSELVVTKLALSV